MGEPSPKDLAARPLPFFISWGMPLLILFSMNFAEGIIPFAAIILIMSGSFIWMGLACWLNAKRCRRRHCYYSRIIFLAGALAIILVGFEIVSLGPDGLIIVVYTTLLLALLTYLTEPVFGKYVK